MTIGRRLSALERWRNPPESQEIPARRQLPEGIVALQAK
jgi:hypothetical protein